jgi:hypothetical protein
MAVPKGEAPPNGRELPKGADGGKGEVEVEERGEASEARIARRSPPTDDDDSRLRETQRGGARVRRRQEGGRA